MPDESYQGRPRGDSATAPEALRGAGGWSGEPQSKPQSKPEALVSALRGWGRGAVGFAPCKRAFEPALHEAEQVGLGFRCLDHRGVVLACVEKTHASGTRTGGKADTGGQARVPLSAREGARRRERARLAGLGVGQFRPVGLMGHSWPANRALFSTRRLAEEGAVGLPLLARGAAALALQSERVLDEPPRKSESEC